MAMHKTNLSSFLAKCDRSGGVDSCWMWLGRVSRRYGIVSMENRPVRSNRASWILHFGAIPESQFVCHTCDVPLCCNPSHLFLGTAWDNNHDKVAKGRQTKGEQVSGAILGATQVVEIRRALASGNRGARLAERFGVSPVTISAIKHGRIWRHVPSFQNVGM